MYGISVRGIASKMKSTQALDGDHFPTLEAGDCLGDRIGNFHPLPCRVPELQLRSAFPAGTGLRVEPAIAWVLVLCSTFCAHGKRGHRGERPIVRDVAHDGEARPAVRAIDKGIAKPAVGGIE